MNNDDVDILKIKKYDPQLEEEKLNKSTKPVKKISSIFLDDGLV